jgi:hypothetical protein
MAEPSSRSLARLVRAGLLLALAACASKQSPPPVEAPVDDDSAVLIPTGQLAAPPFMVLQRVRGKYGTQDVAFECVVQLSQGKLTVTGITPYATRAFVIEQDGVEVRSEAFMLRDVWFDPLQVLYDVHRAFFRGLPAAQTNGVHEQLDHGEFVRELWQDGHLVERRFHALETSASLIVISFEGAPAPLIAPRMRLYNLHYSYWLEIENVQQKRLDDGFSLAVEKEPAQ